MILLLHRKHPACNHTVTPQDSLLPVLPVIGTRRFSARSCKTLLENFALSYMHAPPTRRGTLFIKVLLSLTSPGCLIGGLSIQPLLCLKPGILPVQQDFLDRGVSPIKRD